MIITLKLNASNIYLFFNRIKKNYIDFWNDSLGNPENSIVFRNMELVLFQLSPICLRQTNLYGVEHETSNVASFGKPLRSSQFSCRSNSVKLISSGYLRNMNISFKFSSEIIKNMILMCSYYWIS